MILLQISSAQGPDECALAVALALRQLQKEAATLGVEVTVAEQEPARRAGSLRSVLLSLDGDAAEQISHTWCGTLQWTCESPWRGGNGRKNWFIGVARYSLEDAVIEGEIKFESLKSSGPEGSMLIKRNQPFAQPTLPAASWLKCKPNAASMLINGWQNC